LIQSKAIGTWYKSIDLYQVQKKSFTNYKKKGEIIMSNGKFWIDEDEKELVLSDGTGESRFIIEDDLVIEGIKYLIIVDARAGENADATVVKIINEGEEEIIIPVEEKEEFEKVQTAYLESIDE